MRYSEGMHEFKSGGVVREDFPDGMMAQLAFEDFITLRAQTAASEADPAQPGRLPGNNACGMCCC